MLNKIQVYTHPSGIKTPSIYSGPLAVSCSALQCLYTKCWRMKTGNKEAFASSFFQRKQGEGEQGLLGRTDEGTGAGKRFHSSLNAGQSLLSR